MLENIKLSAFSHFYFIGIGGIGMSALARYFNMEGKSVSGYDKVETTLTRKLVSEGIKIHYDDDPKNVPNEIDLVVYTPAIPKNNKELNWCESQGFLIMKRAQVLGLLSNEKPSIAVAGTHGKTSTSSIIAHLLTYSGREASAFVGGIMKNYDSNYIHGKSDWIVVEADEYDRSFLNLKPSISILISVDADHLDIYEDHQKMIDSFKTFLSLTKADGVIIIHDAVTDSLGTQFMDSLSKSHRVFIYSKTICNKLYEELQALENHFFTGDHNLENAIAASYAARTLEISKPEFIESMASFQGIKRRFEKVYASDRFLYIDDYAHHPTELNSVIAAVREIAGDRKVLGIFQPHLYSRTRDFAAEFADSLNKLDSIILLDIYPAREAAIPGVSSDLIFNQIENENKFRAIKENVIEVLEANLTEVVLSLGAGDIDTCVIEIKEFLESIDE